MTSALTDARALLDRHNPLLVTLPERPDTLHPPSKMITLGRPRGDYHPISAQLFIAHATLQAGPMARAAGWRWLARLSGLPLGWREPEGPRGADIRGAIDALTHPDQSRGWFLDLTRIPSQRRKQAWTAYARIVRRTDAAVRREARVVYGRLCQGRDGTRALQYWYLYAYNDFFNKHEGDWEMVTIELDPTDRPLRAGYSAHETGSWRPWEEVRRDSVSRRPLLFVARGSHAGYFAYRERGWPPHLRVRTGFGPAADLAAGAPCRLGRALNLVRDRPPAAEPTDVDWRPRDAGVVLSPAMCQLPDGDEPWGDDAFWWLRFRGRWGSAHPRLNGAIGPVSPWAPNPGDQRWTDPIAWLDSLPRDPARPARSPLVDLSAVPNLGPETAAGG